MLLLILHLQKCRVGSFLWYPTQRLRSPCKTIATAASSVLLMTVSLCLSYQYCARASQPSSLFLALPIHNLSLRSQSLREDILLSSQARLTSGFASRPIRAQSAATPQVQANIVVDCFQAISSVRTLGTPSLTLCLVPNNLANCDILA